MTMHDVSVGFIRPWWLEGPATQADAGADVTAPTLTSPTGAETGSTTALGTVSTDEANGTLYWIVDQSALAPSVAQIQAGQDQGGAAADASGDQAVTATGVQNIGTAGLVASTTYYFHYQHQDAATNDSTVVSSASFTTDAAGGYAGSFSGRRRRRWRH